MSSQREQVKHPSAAARRRIEQAVLGLARRRRLLRPPVAWSRLTAGDVWRAPFSPLLSPLLRRAGVPADSLSLGLGETAGREAACGAIDAATEACGRATELQVVLNVRTAFFDAYASRALGDVAGEPLNTLRRHLAQIEGFVKVG